MDDKIREKVRSIIMKKERKQRRGDSTRTFGNIRLLTYGDIENILSELEIDRNKVASGLIQKIDEAAVEVRKERLDSLLKEAADIYEQMLQIIYETGNYAANGLKVDDLRKMNEQQFVDAIYEGASGKEKQIELISLKKEYDKIRNTVLFYHEALIRWTAHEVKKNSYMNSNISYDEIMENLGDYFIVSYYAYIRKYNDSTNPSNRYKLSTFFLNNVTTNFNVQGVNYVHAGVKLKSDLTDDNLMVHIPRNIYEKMIKVSWTMQELQEKLGRKPYVSEIDDELGYSEKTIMDILSYLSIYENGLDSLDEMDDRAYEEGTGEISDEMLEVLGDAFDDAYAEEYEDRAVFERDKADLKNISNVPRAEDGIITDSFADDEVKGYDDTLFRQVLEEMSAEDVKKVLSTLPEKERQIIISYFGLDGEPPLTIEEIGAMFGVTRLRISNFISKALAMLRHPSRGDRISQYEKLEDEYYNPIIESGDGTKKIK